MPILNKRANKTPLGLYVHVPFCRSKCDYCDFYSLPHGEDRMDAYTDALCAHLTEAAPLAASHTVDTVYFGGGTPSYLGEKRLCKILKVIEKRYQVARDAEITLEANPDSACDVKALRALRRAGFNRISLGVQSADDGLLRAIGRVHTFAQVQEAVAAVRKAGFKNLSMDLIYGLPGQTMQQWEDTLAAVIALAPEHVSCYGLKLEPGTPLYDRRDSERFPDDDGQADMYLYTVAALEEAGKLAEVNAIHLGDLSCISMDYMDRFTVKLDYDADFAYELQLLEMSIASDKIQDNMTGTFDMRQREDGSIHFRQNVRG